MSTNCNKEVITMGRARKVIDMQIGNISKQKKLNRKMQEEKIKIDRDALMAGAPSWLSERAAAEYNRVVREAAAIDMLDNLDMSVLAIYADNYDRYLDAAEYLQENGQTYEGRGGPVMSPYVKIAESASNQIMKCSTKLGLATTDRLKLIVPEKESKEVNKFLKYV